MSKEEWKENRQKELSQLSDNELLKLLLQQVEGRHGNDDPLNSIQDALQGINDQLERLNENIENVTGSFKNRTFLNVVASVHEN